VLQIDSREKTSFMETSTFERAGKHIREGAWLYRSGEVEPVVVVDDEEEENMEIKGSGDSNQE
jgi:4-hydroxyphenylpyruvate dioxygenase-like putative hemolysin